MTGSRPPGVPDHLPARLTITLWDFSWYTQAAAGEPFHDLDLAFAQAVERGYNTVRVCAMPFLLFGEHDVDPARLAISGLGGGAGVRTRWYDTRGGYSVDGRARLRALLEAARRHDCFVILSSWEYQQSSAFLADSRWYDALRAVPGDRRHVVMARAMTRLVDHLVEHGLADRIAYTELHNEVDLSRLRDVPGAGSDPFRPQQLYVERAVAAMREAHPDVLATASFGIPPHLDLDALPEGLQVGHFHVYVYGVLGALERWAGVREEGPEFPSERLRRLLRPDAPGVAEYAPELPGWRLEATGVSRSMLYTYDWVDTDAWDRWLYRRWGAFQALMETALDERLEVLARWSERHDIPFVVGEGWIGYTPLDAEFEDGPVGRGFAERAVRRCVELGAWGAVVGSNSAPHHPGWSNVRWQRSMNALLAAGASSPADPDHLPTSTMSAGAVDRC